MALTATADGSPVDALPFYDEPERAGFARSRWPAEGATEGAPHGLPAPVHLSAFYDAAAVNLRWEPGPGTGAYLETLPQNHVLAFRVYRGEGLDEPRPVATVELSTHRWRDADLPLAGGRLTYQVWAVQLLVDPEGVVDPVLVTAEPGQPVTIDAPEHFNLVLVGGSATEAIIRVELGPAARPVGSSKVVLHPGDELKVGDQTTGLVLADLQVRDEQRLATREHLDLKSDGTVVLDPETHEPRTTETQVLVPVTRLTATLTDRAGARRTLELDLP